MNPHHINFLGSYAPACWVCFHSCYIYIFKNGMTLWSLHFSETYVNWQRICIHHIPQNSVLRADINVRPYSTFFACTHRMLCTATYKWQKSRKEVQQFLRNCPPSDSHFIWRSLGLPHAKNEVSHLEHYSLMYFTPQTGTLHREPHEHT